MRRTALIFRYELLALSETFIQAQAEALKDFRPCYTGIQRVSQSLPIPQDAVVLMRDNSFVERVRRRVFLHTGRAPSFYRALRASAPTLIHAHFAPDGALALPLATELGIPLIVSLHGYDVTSSEESLGNSFRGRLFLERREALFATASVFICVSEFIKQKALEAGFPESKLRVHYIGVDRTLFVPSLENRRQNLVLFVGRLVEKKGCKYLIEAMQIVQRRCPDVVLAVIGEGPLRVSLESLAKDRSINVRFLGSQPATVVREWLSRARVFCVPSITAGNGDSEGLGMVFAEAQATGVPVVSFKHGGIPEVVRHAETGLLAAEGDYESLAEHLLRYLTDEAFWRACSNEATKWIQQRFDLHQQTAELGAIYATLAGAVERKAAFM